MPNQPNHAHPIQLSLRQVVETQEHRAEIQDILTRHPKPLRDLIKPPKSAGEKTTASHGNYVFGNIWPSHSSAFGEFAHGQRLSFHQFAENPPPIPLSNDGQDGIEATLRDLGMGSVGSSHEIRRVKAAKDAQNKQIGASTLTEGASAITRRDYKITGRASQFTARAYRLTNSASLFTNRAFKVTGGASKLPDIDSALTNGASILPRRGHNSSHGRSKGNVPRTERLQR